MKNQGALYQELLVLSKETENSYGIDGFCSVETRGDTLKSQIETTIQSYIHFGKKVSIEQNDIHESMFLIMLSHINLLKLGVHLVYPQDLREETEPSIPDVQENIYGLFSYLASQCPLGETTNLMARTSLRQVLSAVFAKENGFSLSWEYDSQDEALGLLHSDGPCQAFGYFKYILAKMDVGSVKSYSDWVNNLASDRELWWNGELSSFPNADTSLVPVALWKSVTEEMDFVTDFTTKSQNLKDDPTLSNIEDLEALLWTEIPAKRGDNLSFSMKVRSKSLGLSGVSVMSPDDCEQILNTARGLKMRHDERHDLLKVSSTLYKKIFQETDNIHDFIQEQTGNIAFQPVRQELISVLENGVSDTENWESALEKADVLSDIYGKLVDFGCQLQLFGEDGFHLPKDRHVAYQQGFASTSEDSVTNMESLFDDALQQVLFRLMKDTKNWKEGSIFHPESLALWKDLYWKTMIPQSEKDIIPFFTQALYPLRLKISKEWKSLEFKVGSLTYARLMLVCKKVITLALEQGDTGHKGFFRVEFATEKMYGSGYFTMSFEFSASEESVKSLSKDVLSSEIPEEFIKISDYFSDFAKKYHIRENLTGNKKDTFYQWKQKERVYHGKFFMDESLFQVGEDV